jgi:hypothetical protein
MNQTSHPNNLFSGKSVSERKKERKSRKQRAASVSSTQEVCDAKARNGRWSLLEHVRFLEALKNFGKNWKKVEEHVATRTST